MEKDGRSRSLSGSLTQQTDHSVCPDGSPFSCSDVSPLSCSDVSPFSCGDVSPVPSTIRPLLCVVNLLNGDVHKVTVEKHARGQLLFDKVCAHLQLSERDYFGLTYSKGANQTCGKGDNQFRGMWLDLEKKIVKQNRALTFAFALKFYPPEPAELEILTRSLVFLQLRRDVLLGKLHCTPAAHAVLGSYAVQADIGDYDPIDHGTGVDYIRDMPFAPDQTEDLIYKIAALHKQHKGQTPAQAALHYLEYSHKMDLYGLDLHQVKDAENKDILLGIGAAGISTYRENILINKFNWPKILKISYRRNKFLLRVKPAESSSFESWVTFKLPDNKAAKALWKITVEHHVFIRLRSADQAKKRFSRSGSKFRFTGRTLHQARTNAAAPQESNKAKTRHSLGSLFHRSKTMNYSLLPS